MPEATAARRHTPAPSRSADEGSVAGRQPEATGATTDLPAPSAPAGEEGADLAERVRAAADGLRPLVATAREAQQARAKAHGAPRWTDVFTTQFTEFSNRPRLR